MLDELTELMDTAIYKEIASQSFYLAAQNHAEDPVPVEMITPELF